MLSTGLLIWLPLLAPLAEPTADEALAEARKLAASGTRAAFEAAGASLEQATQKFGGDARIHAALSEIYSEQAYWGFEKPYDAARKAKTAATKAIGLNDASPEAHTAMGILHLYYDWYFPDAEAEFKKAIAYKSDYAPAHSGYARCLACMGKLKEAQTEAKKAVELAPNSAATRVALGRVLFAAAEYDTAAEQFAKAIELNPANPAAYAQLGMTQLKLVKTEALASIDKAVEVSGRDAWAVARLGAAQSVAGDRTKGVDAMGTISTLTAGKFLSGFDMALLYATIGEKDTALMWLGKAVEERAPRLIDIRDDPFFYRLRNELRYKDLLRQMSLPELKTP